MNEERRQRLGIPIHRQEDEHSFVDGYCTCGANKKSEIRGWRYLSTSAGRTLGRSNLDIIEGNAGDR